MTVCACSDQPLVLGELRCAGTVCDRDAPTLSGVAEIDQPWRLYDVVAARTLPPSWVYELPLPQAALPNLRPAPDGGVWVSYAGTPAATLLRLDGEGQRVASYPFEPYGALFVDDTLQPRILSYDVHMASTFAVDAEGATPINAFKFASSRPTDQTSAVLTAEGGVRAALFSEEGSYVAAYAPSGELLWKQTEIRDARDFPFADLAAGLTQPTSYGLVSLSDGALAVGVPKNIEGVQGLTGAHTQGITLLEADGMLRWDFWFGGAPSFNVLLAAGLDGSVIASNASNLSASTLVIDRDGKVIARWTATRADYHSVDSHAIAQDRDGDVYVATLSGARDTPMPTICKLPLREPEVEVICIAVEWPTLGNWHSGPGATIGLQIRNLIAPDPGTVLFSVLQSGATDDDWRMNVVRVDF
jgi:hypothetical protein